MAFDIEKLTSFCADAIHRFSVYHANETFYSFAIDASMLCLNSVEKAKETLERYQTNWEHTHREINSLSELTEVDRRYTDSLLDLHEKHAQLDRSNEAACVAVINESRAESRKGGNPYLQPEEIRSLQENTGDWEYQGFAEMTDEVGFDSDAYDDHYNMEDEEQRNSPYGRAMDQLLMRLKEMKAFDCLNKTPDFIVTRVEHNY